jgi:hypothetical protein
VFAFLILAHDVGEGLVDIKPDYLNSVRDVCIDTIRAILSQEHGSRIFAAVKLDNSTSFDHLPSWVSDWSCQTDVSHEMMQYTYNPFKSCVFMHQIVGRTFVLEGVVLDKIVKCGEPNYLENLSTEG